MINSFKPIVSDRCKILVLGTMPGVQSLAKQQYYGHKQNSFWKIIYALFDKKPEEDYELKKEFLLQHGIALWDVLESCEREGSADAEIKNPVPNDIAALLKNYPGIRSIYFNGNTAENLFKKYIIKNIEGSFPLLNVLPSTSPANAIPFEKKLQNWQLVKAGLAEN